MMNKEPTKPRRSGQQNRALHKYCDLVAGALNDAGLTIEEVLKHFTMEIDWTKDSVKLLLWKTAQKRMFNKESTRDLDKHQEITALWEVMNRFLAKMKVESIPFPSEQELMREAQLKERE